MLDRVFEEMAQRDGQTRTRRACSGEELAERVEQVTAALSEEGILDDVTDEGAAYRLRNVGCPYRSAAEGAHAACAADRRAIELLVEAPVTQLTTIAGGAASCEYLVEKP